MKMLLLLIHWLGGGYLIRFDQILGPHGGDFDQKCFWKVKSSNIHAPVRQLKEDAKIIRDLLDIAECLTFGL